VDAIFSTVLTTNSLTLSLANKMSNPFEIAAIATKPVPLPLNLVPKATRPGPKLKSLAERESLHTLQLARHNSTPIATTADGLLAQFKVTKDDESDPESSCSGDIRRRSYTREQKLAAIGYATTKRVWDEKKQQMVVISHKQACRDLGLEPIILRRWKKNANNIRMLRKGQRKGKLTHPCNFPAMEDRLHTLILEKRKIGRKVGENWIRRNARIEFEKLWPEKVTIVAKKRVFHGMAFSDGWLTGFLKRKSLSLRQPTKKAQTVPEDYKEKIVNWLQFNRRAQAKFNFELSEIANMDQTPISFEFLDNKTYDTKGVKTVFVKQTGSGWDRRQATLQILVHADGIQRCKPLLIFHGKNQDHRQKPKASNLKREYKRYDSRVEVMFNPKAWSNAELMVEWIKHLYTPSTNYPFFPRNSTQRPPRFLSLDVFAGQKTKEVIDCFKSIWCTTSFIPGGTTGFIQVCDTTINKSLKARIEELADQYIDEHEVEWVQGKYSVGDRRVLLTKWVGQAWEDMHIEDGEMIRQAFKYVGLGLPVDGSRDDEIKIKDFPNVQVGNWKDWQPTKGEDREELQSNLTPEEVEKLASRVLIDDEDGIVDVEDTITVEV
jgi:transposase-like protein